MREYHKDYIFPFSMDHFFRVLFSDGSFVQEFHMANNDRGSLSLSLHHLPLTR